MIKEPTGTRRDDAAATRIVLTRTFRAPIEDVWAALTEPARLARWIGSYTGDPADGEVGFTMTAEEGAVEERMEIRECQPPQRLAVIAHTDQGPPWDLDLDIREQGGVTTLAFSQVVTDPAAIESVGPGWEYYLDRLVAAESGGDVAAIDFNDYYPAMLEHYRGLFAR